MSLASRIHLDLTRNRIVSMVGSGGKTSLLFALAHEAVRAGLHTAVTTTTHIMKPVGDGITVITNSNYGELIYKKENRSILVVGTPAKEGKLSAPPEETLTWLCETSDLLLIEADGSRRLPIKFPNAYEPVIVPQTQQVIAVAGLTALGKPLGEVCHRWERVQEHWGFPPTHPVTPELMAKVLFAGYGRFDPLVVLNQADTPYLVEQGEQIAALLRRQGIDSVVISLKQEGYETC